MSSEVMVVVRARLRAGEAARLLDAVGGFVTATRAEPGCREYALYVSATEFEELATVERWASAEHAAAHMVAPHTRRFLALASECLAGPPEFRTFPVG
jgi:quinol monooxygenase YgiN